MVNNNSWDSVTNLVIKTKLQIIMIEEWMEHFEKLVNEDREAFREKGKVFTETERKITNGICIINSFRKN